MKGSVKVKFDLGWAMSVIVALVLVVGGAARLSFTYSVQSKANQVCKITSKRAAEASEAFDFNDYYDACTSVEKKPNLQVMMDFDAWTYEDVYPNLTIKTFKY